MRIMVISDEESSYLWDHFDNSKLEGIDLIISCGDLKPAYLSFLATFTNAPVLYVHGNHDESYEIQPPDGCVCIEDRIYVHEGIRIMGLGGCKKYHSGNYHYTERQMRRRIRRIIPKIWWHRGIDILVTHAPASGIGDGNDIAHRGFDCFHRLLDRYHPRFFVHGHNHMRYDHRLKRWQKMKDIIVINASERFVFDYEADAPSHLYYGLRPGIDEIIS